MTLEPGTLILCWNCHAAFMEIVNPLSEGGQILPENFKYVLKENGPAWGEEMRCTECGAHYNDFTTMCLPISDSVQYAIKKFWYAP